MPGHDPILLDLGTGLRYFGLGCRGERAFRGTCLLSHLHWDHVQGLPFFAPILHPDAHFDIYVPAQTDGRDVAEVMDATICPPLFPIRVSDLPGEIVFHETGDDDFSIGDIRVSSRLIPHIGATCGYRIEYGGGSLAYLSDHQQPGVDVYEASDAALELCRGVDVLVHDAQYTRAEFESRATWGHCTADYALWLAAECGARELVLFHHDPSHHDDMIDALVADLAVRACRSSTKVIAAREGMTTHVGPGPRT